MEKYGWLFMDQHSSIGYQVGTKFAIYGTAPASTGFPYSRLNFMTDDYRVGQQIIIGFNFCILQALQCWDTKYK